MPNNGLRWEVGDLARRAEGLTSAGIGLEQIGLLLNESELSSNERNGLEQAVRALGDYVRRAGYDLYAQADRMKGGEK